MLKFLTLYLLPLTFIILISKCRKCYLKAKCRAPAYIPMARTSTVLHKSSAVVSPSFWNRLPSNLHNVGLSLSLFCKHLKSILFYRDWCCQVGSASEEILLKWCYKNLQL